VTVCNFSFSPGRVLREMDPTAFRCGMSEMDRWKCTECGVLYDDECQAEECCPEEE